MMMSNQIDKAFVQQFSDNLIVLSQQRGSKLAMTVRRQDVTGKYYHFDRLGVVSAKQKTSRHSAVEYVDTPHSRRRGLLEDFYASDLIDREDEVRMLIDPKSDYARVLGYSIGRRMDDVIIAAAVGDSTSVDSDDATSTVALAHTIDEDFVTANSDITVEKFLEAERILRANEVDIDSEELYFVLDATALAAMLNITKATSRDFQPVYNLNTGKIDKFLSFNVIQSERLTTSSEGFKQCLAYCKSGIGLGMGKDMMVKIDQIPERHYQTQVYVGATFGAVRIEEEKVIVVEAYRA